MILGSWAPVQVVLPIIKPCGFPIVPCHELSLANVRMHPDDGVDCQK